jgi:Rod binding domain-containing protein
MRDAGFGDELFDSETTKTFTGMLDQQYVHALTRGPGLGLADTIVKQVEYLSGGRVKDGAADAVKQPR